MFRYAYLQGVLFWLILWFTLFLLWPGQRRALLAAGLLFAPLGVILAYWSLDDYWHPDYVLAFVLASRRFGGGEDLVLGFALGGLSAGVFERVGERVLGW